MRNIRPGRIENLPGLTLTDREDSMDIMRGYDGINSRKLNEKVTRGRRSVLILCLLVLLGGVSCTEKETSQQEQKQVEAPPAPVVKKPLPLHGEQVAKAEAPLVSVDKKDVAKAAPETRIAAQHVAPGASVPAAKDFAKQKEEPKKPATPPAVEKKTLPAKASLAKEVGKDQKTPALAKVETKKSAVAGIKPPAAVAKKPLEKEKTPAPAKAAASGVKKPLSEAGKAGARSWALVVGTYLLEDFMAPDLVKVRKAGLDASVQSGPRKKTTMNRLFLAEFADRNAAMAELEKLKVQTADAFVLDHGAKHVVYAGSYLLPSRAASEKERLAAAGFPLTLKQAVVAIPSKKLTAGIFTDRKEAEKALQKLREAGLKATLSPR